MSSILNRTRMLRSLEANGSIAVKTPSFSNSGSIEISLKKPDSLLFKVEGPFGIDVARGLITSGNFMVYNSLNNQLVRGTTSRHVLESFLQMDIEFSDVLNMFTGSTLLDRETGSPEHYYANQDDVIMIFKQPGGSSKYWINPENTTVSRIDLLNARGQVEKEVSFSQYKLIDTLWIPFKMKVQDYTAQKTVTLVYSDARVNQKSLSCDFIVPDQAETIEWH